MERPFLPFNDYLGLSSMFQQGINNQEPEPEKHCAKEASMSRSSIDKQIEEILHQYSLKLSQQNMRNNVTFSTSANAFSLPNICHNDSIVSTIGPNAAQPTANNMFSMFNSGRPNSAFSSPSQVSRINSLSNSPMSPSLHFDSPPPISPWLNSAASSVAPPLPSHCSMTPQFTVPSSTSAAPKESIALPQLSADMTSFNAISNDTQSAFLKQTSQRQLRRSTVGCSFCRNNKEVDDWVMSHQLKDSLNRVLCPILRSYMCPLCFASGDNAHTLGHCPLNPDKRNSSLPLAVRRRTNATGRVKL